MNSITVYCGNGGDYEYENDRARWILWITRHKEADKAIVEFDDEKNAVLFALKCPNKISYDCV